MSAALPKSSRYSDASDTIERGQNPPSAQPASYDEPVERESIVAANDASPPSAMPRYGEDLASEIADRDNAQHQHAGDHPHLASEPTTASQSGESSVLQASAEQATSGDRYGVTPPSDADVDSGLDPTPAADATNAQGNDPTAAPREFPPPADSMTATTPPRIPSTLTPNEPTPAGMPAQAGADRYGQMPNPDDHSEGAAAAAESLAGAPAIEGGDAIGSTEGTGRPGSKRLEGPQTPQLALQKFAPSEIQVGRECVFEIKVRNTGEFAAQNVQIHDEIPEGTQLVSTTPNAVRGPDGRVVWELGALGPGDQASVEMRLMPIDEGEIGSVATVKFETAASVRTKSTRPALAIRLTAASDQVMIGEKIAVKVEVSNPGTGDATGVMLLENVPDKVTHPAGQTLEFEIGTLAVGETRELELMLTAAEAGKVINTLTARGDASLHVVKSVEFEVIAPALEVSVQGPKRRFLDRQATYQVAVTNPGTAAARDVELITRLPEGMKFVKADNSGHYDAATHAVYWSLEELPPSQEGKVELVMLPVAPGDHVLKIEGTAQQGLKHTAQQQVRVEGIAAIMFEVVDVNDPIVVGEETTYEIRVVNQGSKEATNVVIEAQFPAGMEPISAAGPSGHKISTDRVTFEPLRQLAPKADTTYRIKAKGISEGDRRIHVRLVTGEVKKPVTKEVSTHVYKDE